MKRKIKGLELEAIDKGRIKFRSRQGLLLPRKDWINEILPQLTGRGARCQGRCKSLAPKG